MERWTLTIVNKTGFSCYTIIDIDEIMDMGDSYNVVANGMEIWMDKEHCVVKPECIHYNSPTLEVYLESLALDL